MQTDHPITHPPALLAIIRAARLTGDSALECEARQLLRDEHGIEVVFRERPDGGPITEGGPDHAA